METVYLINGPLNFRRKVIDGGDDVSFADAEGWTYHRTTDTAAGEVVFEGVADA